MKKYQLPIVASLQKIGFKFEFKTIKEAQKYIKKFVKKNRKELLGLFSLDFDADEYKDRQSFRNCISDSFVIETVKTKIRISRGKIQKKDYMWIIPPWLKENKTVLLNVYQKRLEKYMVDTNLAFYDCTYMGISRKKAQQLVLYNELLRLIIESFPANPFGYQSQDNRDMEYQSINDKIDDLRKKGYNFMQAGRKLIARSCFHQISSLEDDKYELLFSEKLTVLEEARRSLNKILDNQPYTMRPKYTSITEKENVILQYLKLQAPKIRASKNTRGTGANAIKKQSVLNYKSDYPDASISEIARKCSVDRKTVRKYVSE